MKSLGADKAYKSKEIDDLLESKNIQNNVCLKETKKMSDEDRKNQREDEKPKHKIRAKVEHSFAHKKIKAQKVRNR